MFKLTNPSITDRKYNRRLVNIDLVVCIDNVRATAWLPGGVEPLTIDGQNETVVVTKMYNRILSTMSIKGIQSISRYTHPHARGHGQYHCNPGCSLWIYTKAGILRKSWSAHCIDHTEDSLGISGNNLGDLTRQMMKDADVWEEAISMAAKGHALYLPEDSRE